MTANVLSSIPPGKQDISEKLRVSSKKRPVRERIFTNKKILVIIYLQFRKKGDSNVRIRIETAPDAEEEIVIRCKEKTDKILLLESMVANALKSQSELSLSIGRTEYYISKADILFFETSDGKVYAHTASGMYASEYRLFEVENIMPSYFVRISKSAIVNTKRIRFLHRELTGNGEIGFNGCDKKVYFSRGYYKLLRDKIEETRLKI